MPPDLLINSLRGGGSEKQGRLLAENLKIERIFLLEKEDAPAGMESEIFFLSNRGADACPFAKTLSVRSCAAELAERLEPGSAVISFMERSNFVNTLAKKKKNHKAIICERTTPSREFSGIRVWLNKPKIKKLYPLADAIIANSAGVKKDLVENFSLPAEKISVIRNMFPVDEIERKSTKPLTAEEEKIFSAPVLIGAGRLTQAKGQFHMLRIFAVLKKKIPEARLVVLGDGPLKEDLISFARDLKLKVCDCPARKPRVGRDVYFFGERENPYKYFSRAKLFLLTSLWEGFPNVLVESMICRTPCLSSDILSGPREILSGEEDEPVKPLRDPDFSEYGVLMPAFEKWGRAEPRKENVWAGTAYSVLKNEKIMNEYREKAKSRSGDFSVEKILPLWKEMLNEYGV